MSDLSRFLADIETSAAKIKTLGTELEAEKANGKTLVEQYRAQSGEALKILGIEESPTQERKARTPEAT